MTQSCISEIVKIVKPLLEEDDEVQRRFLFLSDVQLLFISELVEIRRHDSSSESH